MITDLLLLAVGATGGWFACLYRERILRVKNKIKAVVDEELKR